MNKYNWRLYGAPSLITVEDIFYDLMTKYNGCRVGALFGEPTYARRGQPLDKSIFLKDTGEAHLVQTTGLMDDPYIPSTVEFELVSFVSRRFYKYFSYSMDDVDVMNFTFKGAAIPALVRDGLDKMSAMSDRLALSSLVGNTYVTKDVDTLHDIITGIDAISDAIDQPSKLPLTRYIPLNYDHYRSKKEAPNGGMGQEGLSFSKIIGAYCALTQYNETDATPVLVVPKGSMNNFYNDQSFTQVNLSAFGLANLSAAYTGAMQYKDMLIIEMPKSHFPETTHIYHTMENGNLEMFETGTGAEVNNNLDAKIAYGYGFLMGGKSVKWGIREKLGDAGYDRKNEQYATLAPDVRAAGGGNVPVDLIFPDMYIDQRHKRFLEMTLRTEMFFGRLRDEAVCVVELNADPKQVPLLGDEDVSSSVTITNAALTVDVPNGVQITNQIDAPIPTSVRNTVNDPVHVSQPGQ